MARPAVGSLAGAIQTFITPSLGARQLSHLPSGLIWPAVRVGLPNRCSRGISGAASAFALACWRWSSAAAEDGSASELAASSAAVNLIMIVFPLW